MPMYCDLSQKSSKLNCLPLATLPYIITAQTLMFRTSIFLHERTFVCRSVKDAGATEIAKVINIVQTLVNFICQVVG